MSKTPIYHLKGYYPCGDIAFYYSGPIGHGAIIQSKYASFADGSKPKAGESIICGACKRPVAVSDICPLLDDRLVDN